MPGEEEALVPCSVRGFAETVAGAAESVVVGALLSGPTPLVAGLAAEPRRGREQSQRLGEAVTGRRDRRDRFECVDGDQSEVVPVRESQCLVPAIFVVVDEPREGVGHRLAGGAAGRERCDGRTGCAGVAADRRSRAQQATDR